MEARGSLGIFSAGCRLWEELFDLEVAEDFLIPNLHTFEEMGTCCDNS
jgi:hypothetical protein